MRYWRRQFPVSVPSPNTSMETSQKTFGNLFELGRGVQQERGWKGIATLLVVIFVCSLIGLAFHLLTPRGDILAQDDNVSQSVRNHLLKRPPQAWINKAHFISDNAIVYTDLYLGPVRLSLDKMEPERLLNYSLGIFNPIPSYDYRYYALCKRRSSSVTRKFNGKYVVSIVDRELYAVHETNFNGSSKELTERVSYKVGVTKTDGETLRFFKWSPISYEYVFWQDGHLYYSESPESLTTSVRITSEGLNWEYEIADPFYSANVFDHEWKTVWWSKKGKKLAFLSKDKVEENSMLMLHRSGKLSECDTTEVYEN
ncbi:hypothetical protein RB195_009229 [Necator americanus]|uniref:Dipeptidylpeptidase IV N-terminal domain-containing protein n=1 Tax=Necator americanus TaxID=51031 RepID=A0ABR1CUA4_NECAM